MTGPQAPRPPISGLARSFAWRAFALPQGVLGRAGGWIMSRDKGAAQQEIIPLLGVRPGDRVLELGYGPGELLRLLAGGPAASVIGVDPSPLMRARARRRCASLVASGRVRPDLGSAADTRLPDEAVDRVVSVNNVLFWGDIPAGLAELRRVLRPGGTLVVAFHSRQAPSRLTRRLALPEATATQIETAMRAVFGAVVRHELVHLTAFAGRRLPDA